MRRRFWYSRKSLKIRISGEQRTNHIKIPIKFKTMAPLLFMALGVTLVCFGLAPMAQAVGPDTDGSIAGGNHGEGIGVLVSRTTGIWNTGIGVEALNHLTAGGQNTATGVRALFSDINGGFNTATGVYSLYSNTAGFHNSATGAYSLTRQHLATAIQPTVIQHSTGTPPAATTPPSGSLPVSIRLRAATISISAMPV